MKYRKKPIVIEAIQFTADTCRETCEFIGVHHYADESRCGEDTPLIIYTLEGEMRAEKGDWIIRGVKGEFYPCKPDIFEATYEAVEEDA